MWGNSGGFINQEPHGAILWGNPATDAVSRCGRGNTYHICRVLPQGCEVGGVPNAWMSKNFRQLRSDAGTFHVQKFLIEGHRDAGGKRAVDILRHVQNAHDGRETAHKREDGVLIQE